VNAIECYSRSIALQPTAVAFANRAMALLKIRRSLLLKHFLFMTVQTLNKFSVSSCAWGRRGSICGGSNFSQLRVYFAPP